MSNQSKWLSWPQKLLVCCLCFWGNLVCADAPQSPPSVGGASINLLGPIGAFTHVLYNICYILGAGLLLGSIVRYREYRDNPSQTPISRPIFIFIFGLVLLAIPFIGKLSPSSFAAR